jgi:DNA-binding FadR family transcriptional regulator
MPKTASSLELTLSDLPPYKSIMDWLYAEPRGSILEGRLKPGTGLPASREFRAVASPFGVG